MQLLPHESTSLLEAAVGNVLPIWRTVAPNWQEGRRYSCGDAGYCTVVSTSRTLVRGIQKKDLDRSGWSSLDQLCEELGIERMTTVWEMRIAKGDLTDRFRLLAPSGRKSGDYTSATHQAMSGTADPGEAPSEIDMLRLSQLDQRDRDEAERQWREKTAAEARTMFSGKDSLRNFERVLESLGQDKPGAKKRRTG